MYSLAIASSDVIGELLPSLPWASEDTITNLIPVTLGNIVGGALMVGAVYWWLYGRQE